jgi:hypothetical protein
LSMLARHCAFNGLLDDRPDIVLVCMRTHGPDAVRLLVRYLLTVSAPDEGAASAGSLTTGDGITQDGITETKSEVSSNSSSGRNRAFYRQFSNDILETNSEVGRVVSVQEEASRPRSLFKRHRMAKKEEPSATNSRTTSPAIKECTLCTHRFRLALLRCAMTLIAVGAQLTVLSENADHLLAIAAAKATEVESVAESSSDIARSYIEPTFRKSDNSDGSDLDSCGDDEQTASTIATAKDLLHGLRYRKTEAQCFVDMYCDLIDVCVTRALPSGLSPLPIRSAVNDTRSMTASLLTRCDYEAILGCCKHPDTLGKVFALLTSHGDPLFTYMLGEVAARVNLQLYAWTAYTSTVAAMQSFDKKLLPTRAPFHSLSVMSSKASPGLSDVSARLKSQWCTSAHMGSLFSLLEGFCLHKDSLYLRGPPAAEYLASWKRLLRILEEGTENGPPGLSFFAEEKLALRTTYTLLELVKCRSEFLTSVFRNSIKDDLSNARGNQPLIQSDFAKRMQDCISMQYVKRYNLYCEQQHQHLRNALHSLLTTGYWELGEKLLGAFMREYKDVLVKFQQGGAAMAHGEEDKQNKHVFIHGHLLTESAVSAGKSRIKSLVQELERANDKFKDRLRHEGPVRPKPVYFVVRFIDSPWTTDPAGTSADSQTANTLKRFLRSTEYSFVDVMSSSSSAATGAFSQDGNDVTSNTLAGVGIASNELWLLVKYSSQSFLPARKEAQERPVEHGRHFLEDIEESGGPIGSYDRLVYQVHL